MMKASDFIHQKNDRYRSTGSYKYIRTGHLFGQYRTKKQRENKVPLLLFAKIINSAYIE